LAEVLVRGDLVVCGLIVSLVSVARVRIKVAFFGRMAEHDASLFFLRLVIDNLYKLIDLSKPAKVSA
jgi:hypothetical protein